MRETRRSLWRAACSVGAAGVLFEVTCTPAEMQVVIAGLEVVSQTLRDAQQDDDISFGDYIISELED